MALDLAEIDLDQVSAWPVSVKATVYAIVFVLLILAGYWFDVRGQVSKLEKIDKQQIQLRRDIAEKQKQVPSAKQLKQQIEMIKSYLDSTLTKMPGSSEIPKILEEISAQGIKSGLEFRSIQPLPEEVHKFYARTPIKIVVVGTYHQLGKFAADLAALERYIVVEDFSLDKLKKLSKGKRSSQGRNSRLSPGMNEEEKLVMSLEADIYRSVALP